MPLPVGGCLLLYPSSFPLSCLILLFPFAHIRYVVVSGSSSFHQQRILGRFRSLACPVDWRRVASAGGNFVLDLLVNHLLLSFDVRWSATAARDSSFTQGILSFVCPFCSRYDKVLPQWRACSGFWLRRVAFRYSLDWCVRLRHGYYLGVVYGFQSFRVRGASYLSSPMPMRSTSTSVVVCVVESSPTFSWSSAGGVSVLLWFELIIPVSESVACVLPSVDGFFRVAQKIRNVKVELLLPSKPFCRSLAQAF
ncbi:hypothetical protein Bca4012_071981 [Brassica carinata]